MINSTGNRILLQTKFQRPRLPANLVHRPRLKNSLNDGLNHPLILIAAPAGFGKSTLVSVWLETCDLPYAWISLDKADNDLGAFLAYLVESIQALFSDALPETRAFLTTVSLPTVTVIANTLLNELDNLGRDFILVLDDYHVIREEPIHELLNLLLQHPPPGFHLVIATRQDPLLPLGMLRARDKVADVRGQDLRFSRTEVAEFVEKALGLSLPGEALTVLAEKTEGWAVGLRLATLTLRYGENIEAQIAGLRADNRYILDYLMSEVLANIPSDIRSFLLKTAILDQVCASLGAELIGPDDPTCTPQQYLAWLEEANMFTVALDSRGEWYRYHHLFRDLLRDQLAQQISADEIATLHARASRWYGRQHLLEEALSHALLGRDTLAAVRLVAGQRHALMDAEQWQLHERIFHMFPAETVAEHPDLLLMAAWMARLGRFDLVHVLELVNQAESLLAQMSDQPERIYSPER
jgi:LuxR family transcriptional regulator, maltose regulon positive regulatory protein